MLDPCVEYFCLPEQQVDPQLQLQGTLESSSVNNADDRGGGTNGAPESKL